MIGVVLLEGFHLPHLLRHGFLISHAAGCGFLFSAVLFCGFRLPSCRLLFAVQQKPDHIPRILHAARRILLQPVPAQETPRFQRLQRSVTKRPQNIDPAAPPAPVQPDRHLLMIGQKCLVRLFFLQTLLQLLKHLPVICRSGLLPFAETALQHPVLRIHADRQPAQSVDQFQYQFLLHLCPRSFLSCPLTARTILRILILFPGLIRRFTLSVL